MTLLLFLIWKGSWLAVAEVRVTNAKTGGQKGAKPEEFGLLPWSALAHVARVYHNGAEKYSRDNWRKGFDWHLSYDAAIRHLAAFWEGEDVDPEDGEPHLAHAAFHLLTLMTFLDDPEHYGDLDDRPNSHKDDEVEVTVTADLTQLHRDLEKLQGTTRQVRRAQEARARRRSHL